MSEKKTDGKIPLPPGCDPNDFRAGEPTKIDPGAALDKMMADMDSSGDADAAVGAITQPKEEPRAEVVPSQPPSAAVVPRTVTALEKARIELDQRGLAIPADLDGAYRVAEMWIKGGALPKWIKSATQALAASQFVRAYGLEPLAGIQHLCEINGRYAFWGEAPLGVVRRSGKLEYIDEHFLDKDYQKICVANKNLDAPIFTAVCILKRIDGKEKEFVFTDKEANLAIHGLEPVWKAYRGTMMMRKCRAKGLKGEFGDILMGMPIAEYDHEYAPDLALAEREGKLSAKEKVNKYERPQISQGSESDAVFDMPKGTAAPSDRPVPREDLCEQPIGRVVQHNSDVQSASR